MQGFHKDKSATLNLDFIAEQYLEWIESHPFDIGMNTQTALIPLMDDCFAKVSIEVSEMENQTSMSNGSMMRCTPMAVYSSALLDQDHVRQAVISDVKMTHPNKIVQETILLYVKAIHYLLKNPTDPNRGQKAFDIAFEESKDGEVYEHEGIDNSINLWLQISIKLN